MEQPTNLVANEQERKVYMLQRSIYGLKQSSKHLYLRFHRAIVFNGFTMVEKYHCVYIKWSKESFFILSLHVDDILLDVNKKKIIIARKTWLSSNFKMKNMDEVSYVLRVKIFRDH